MKDLRSHNILIVGSSNADIVIKANHLPRPGKTVLGGIFFMNPGGKGVNQTVAVARLEGQVSFIYKTGNGIFGHQSQQLFEREGIGTSYILPGPKNPSGVVLITVDAHAENYIVVTSGADANLLPSDLARSEKAMEKADLISVQLEISINTVEFVAKMASKKNKRVVLNPAPAQTLSTTLPRHLYMIIPDETEVEMISGVEIADEVSAKKAAQVVMEMGVQNVIITLGSEGALIYCDSMVDMIPAIRIRAVDITAAGDIFGDTLTVALAEGRNLREIVRFTCKALTVSVTRVGARSSAPYRNGVDVFD